MVALTAQELIAWNEATSTGFQGFFAAHPEALALPCDIRESEDVAGLLQHIVAVELRYAERLHGTLETPYEEIPKDSAVAIYGVHDRALALLRDLEFHDDDFWEEIVPMTTRRGEHLQVGRRYMFVHLLMHSIRHYAQLATLLRQHGLTAAWPMDYLFMTPRQS